VPERNEQINEMKKICSTSYASFTNIGVNHVAEVIASRIAFRHGKQIRILNVFLFKL